jgi:phosphatidylglycerophosphate synthase
MKNRSKPAAPEFKLHLNVPNVLTASRVILTVVSAVLLCQHSDRSRLIAGVLLIIAWGTDWLDGFMARRLDQSTAAGGIFDLAADRVLMTGISIITVLLGFWQRAADFIPWAPFPYLIPVWAADIALLTGIVVFSFKRRRLSLVFPIPTMTARLAFPVQMTTLVLAILNIGPNWLLSGMMYLTIASTLVGSYSYLRKGAYIFTAR